MLGRIKKELKQGKTLLQFGFIKATGQALGMIAPLVVARFFSSPKLFGSYSLAKMIVFFFSTLLISSAQTPFIVFANQEKASTGKINKTFSVQCTFLLLSLCIFVILLYSLNSYITAFAGINRGDLFFVFLAFVGLAAKSFLCNLFMAMNQRIKNALAELVYGGLAVSIVFVLYFLAAINLRTVLLVYPIAAFLLLLVFAPTIELNQLFPIKLDRTHFKGMFDFTRWVMLGATAVYFVNWGDNIVLRIYTSISDIGVYNVGYQIFKGLMTLVGIISRYFLPFISQHIGDSERIRVYLYSKRPRLLFLASFGVGILFLVTPRLLRFIYGNLYSEAIVLLRILLIGIPLQLYAVFYHPILGALKRYKTAQIIVLTQVCLNLVLDLILVPVMGTTGAAAATVIAYFCHAVIMEIYFKLKLKNALGL